MNPNYLNMFDEPILYRRKRKSAGYSIAATVVIAALAVIVFLLVWQVSMPATMLTVGDDPAVVLDQQALGAMAATAGNAAPSKGIMSPTEVAAVRTYAIAELAAIQARLEADENYEVALSEIENLEADLELAYGQTAGVTREGWSQLHLQFNAVEDTLRDNDADSLLLLTNLLASFEAV